MPRQFTPSVSSEIFALRPDYCALSIVAEGVENAARHPASDKVDLYNALSVRFAIPIGGENIAAYVGDPVLKRTTGHDTFDTVKDGSPCVETVPAGEVVWADELGVTCRRWNWRQGLRTRIDATTTRMWFVLERLEPMSIPALLEAGRLFAATHRKLSPGAAIASTTINRPDMTPCAEAAQFDRRVGVSGEQST